MTKKKSLIRVASTLEIAHGLDRLDGLPQILEDRLHMPQARRSQPQSRRQCGGPGSFQRSSAPTNCGYGSVHREWKTRFRSVSQS